MFTNIISLYQALYISAGRSKVIAIRNLLISIIQAICIPLSFFVLKNIKAVLIVQLSLDLIQLIYFGLDFSRSKKNTKRINFDFNILKEILKYSIPMGLALMMGTLLKNQTN